MGKATSKWRKPLILESKFLCFSFLYLFTTLFLAIYISLSPSKCIFRSSPFDPIQSPLFSYPESYGQHKHALPTFRSSCNSPVYFSDYWSVFKEIQALFQNSNDSIGHSLRYMKETTSDSFGGDFSVETRNSYFDQENKDGDEIPCGFFKPFPINPYDQLAMESCKGMVVVSANLGHHDKIRQPKGLGSKTLDMVCFFMFVDDTTLKGLQHHKLIATSSQQEYGDEDYAYKKIGVWRLINVNTTNSLYENPAMNGVIPKYLVHRLFPNAKYSIWIDAKLQLVVDPLLLLHSLVLKQDVDMAISRHPFFVHTMEEATATARWRKWLDIDGLRIQMETYCDNGLRPWSPTKLPSYPSDVPDTALILRKHGVANNLFSCLMFNELNAFNHRDQLAFAYVRDKMSPKLKMNMFEVEVFEQIAAEYRHNLKQTGSNTSSQRFRQITRAQPIGGYGIGKCHKYFEEMWGESHN